MKYKTLLLLVFTLILTQKIYAQSENTQNDTVYQWDHDVRVDVFGSFVDGTVFNQATTLNANIWWLGNVPMPGNGFEVVHASFDISISAGEVIAVSANYGGKGECELRIMPGENGSAALYLAYSGDVTLKGINAGGTYLMFIGVIYKDYPNQLFDKENNLIDRKTKKPILDPKTGKPITKAQLDAEKAADAKAKEAAKSMKNVVGVSNGVVYTNAGGGYGYGYNFGSGLITYGTLITSTTGTVATVTIGQAIVVKYWDPNNGQEKPWNNPPPPPPPEPPPTGPQKPKGE